jgi:hypothetical protein
MKEATPSPMAAKKTAANGPFTVFMDDNGKFMDEDARYRAGVFPDYADAVAFCRKVVDEFLVGAYEPGMDAAALYQAYAFFGDDPWIMPPRPLAEGEEVDPETTFDALRAECLASPDYLAGIFSARLYAEKRAREICANPTIDNREETKP